MENNIRPKAALIYHSGDIDGITSALLMKQALYQYDLKLIPYNYETEGISFIDNQTEFLDKYDLIAFVDVTPSNDWMTIYSEHDFKNKYVVLNFIDHHINKLLELENVIQNHYQNLETSNVFVNSAKNIISANDNINTYNIEESSWIKNNNQINFYISFTNENGKSISAAFLTYCYVMIYGKLIMDKKLLEKVKNIEYYVWLVSEYDVWNFTDPFYHPIRKKVVLELQEGLKGYVKFLENKNSIVSLFESNLIDAKNSDVIEFINTCQSTGKSFIAKEIKDLELKTNYYLCEAGELLKINYPTEKFLIVIGEYPSYFAQEWFKEKFNNISSMLFIQIKHEKKLCLLSLRQGNNRGFNCIELIKKLAGPSAGGHFNACGGAIPINSFLNFQTNNFKQIDF